MKYLLRNHTYRTLVVASTLDDLFTYLRKLAEDDSLVEEFRLNLLRVPDDHPEVRR